ncbi:MAG TPA: hypothetical protein PLR35_01565 [Burkholderiaceae bacterium]|nr:hypothetical protein [Burkholderiaceae bacterium]
MLTRWIAAAALLCLSLPTYALGSLVDVQVIDRASGETLPMYWHNGRWWVPGKPGARYAVALTNRTGARTLAVVSVDGVNVVSGESAAPDQTGYVLSRGQFAQITGWRKDMSRVAAFEFTALEQSYAARTGRPDNVGVIGVAVFRERPRPSAPPPAVLRQESSRDAGAAPAPAAEANAGAGETRSRADESQSKEQRLGTAHGRSERSPTTYTDFERAQSTPDELIAIHYDSRDNLLAMGVIPRPRPMPNPFPATAGFVPDPPRP